MSQSYRMGGSYRPPTKMLRSLYIDLIGESEQVIERLAALGQQLEHAQDNTGVLQPGITPVPFRLSSEPTREDRILELSGTPVPYEMSQLVADATAQEQIGIAAGIAAHFSGLIEMEPQQSKIEVDKLTLRFDAAGRIADAPDPRLVGTQLVPALACFIDQDFGVVLRRGSNLVYVYESSEFEKTPKRVEGGENSFLGVDFLEWHRRIPHYGAALCAIFERASDLFERSALEMLVVDLRGRQLYTDGQRVVRRYERNYVVPLRGVGESYLGMIVFADLFVCDINSLRSPLAGGPYLIIDSPIAFNEQFRVIKHGAFREHPRGMRGPDQKPVASW